MLSFSPRGVLDEILNLIESVSEDFPSYSSIFADDCVCYREIKDIEDTVKFQEDIDRLEYWARSWGMRF